MTGDKTHKGSGESAGRSRFDNMSDQELRDYLGGDVDPNLNRSELIALAIRSDTDERGNMPS